MKSAFVFLLSATAVSLAHAEGPMFTDDAGTLDPGRQKLEFVWQKDAATRQPSLTWGISPLENIEVGLTAGHSTEKNSTQTSNTQALSVKWVPLQADQGWSAGVRLDWSRETVQDLGQPDVPTYGQGLTLLGTYRYETGNTWHMNLGRSLNRTGAERTRPNVWALGYEHPLTESWVATAEIHRETDLRPDKALGLRYEIQEGLKLSGAWGRGNDRSFGQIGLAWEY